MNKPEAIQFLEELAKVALQRGLIADRETARNLVLALDTIQEDASQGTTGDVTQDKAV